MNSGPAAHVIFFIFVVWLFLQCRRNAKPHTKADTQFLLITIVSVIGMILEMAGAAFATNKYLAGEDGLNLLIALVLKSLATLSLALNFFLCFLTAKAHEFFRSNQRYGQDRPDRGDHDHRRHKRHRNDRGDRNDRGNRGDRNNRPEQNGGSPNPGSKP